jgi:hypothetical protein
MVKQPDGFWTVTLLRLFLACTITLNIDGAESATSTPCVFGGIKRAQSSSGAGLYGYSIQDVPHGQVKKSGTTRGDRH